MARTDLASVKMLQKRGRRLSQTMRIRLRFTQKELVLLEFKCIDQILRKSVILAQIAEQLFDPMVCELVLQNTPISSHH